VNSSFPRMEERTFDMSAEDLRSVLRISSTQRAQVREGLMLDDVANRRIHSCRLLESDL